ncbi:MAG: TetR/AcrR family transcriptional regulator, partial [Sulfitobacter sp.]
MEAVEEGDHRVRVAKDRRQRMRARLSSALMESFADTTLDGPPSVEDVIARADVSRQTFYKYFKSMDSAIEDQAGEVIDEMIADLQEFIDPNQRPAFIFVVSVK